MASPEAIAIVLGLFAHCFVFIHGEWHLRAPAVVVFHVCVAALLYIWELSRLTANGSWTVVLVGAYIFSLLSSISIYRLFFHRLRIFPGPRLAAWTKLWHVWKCRDSRGHHVLEEWYRQYGEFVRTGPAEITIFHPAAYEAMDGPGNRNTRSDWYDLLYPRISSIFTRDRKLHHERRKMWDHALSAKVLPQYNQKVVDRVRSLEDLISAHSSSPVIINDLMHFFAFDSMGDFAFSEDFIQQSGFLDLALLLYLVYGKCGIGFICWSFVISVWPDGCRMKKTPAERDIASWFIDDHIKHGASPNRARWLSGDTATLVVAGSDTTAPSLTLLFYFLARYPQHIERIYEEIQHVDRRDPSALATLPHLTGTINESMRLLPAVPTFSSRVTPAEGLFVDGTWIPGNIKICAPRYSIGRLESAYVRPLDFIPERWYSQPELIRDKRAFAPFGVGRTSCVGRHLALAHIRLVTVGLVSQYRIRFAPGERNGEAVERDMKDQLTAHPGACRVIFEPR
ncbi:cytochrome P450 [Penicillium alfredii]|uniref:Cytochrome P450 n=1 Tax=Penicillium alfredii TaxID=1506179 RepID=A0A9W9GC00_9EURO|nr:cytochrome P450 [Penicillium alfredii]KAJ5115372.1 cytochrome P450 [Penicillium alfredii]